MQLFTSIFLEIDLKLKNIINHTKMSSIQNIYLFSININIFAMRF